MRVVVVTLTFSHSAFTIALQLRVKQTLRKFLSSVCMFLAKKRDCTFFSYYKYCVLTRKYGTKR